MHSIARPYLGNCVQVRGDDRGYFGVSFQGLPNELDDGLAIWGDLHLAWHTGFGDDTRWTVRIPEDGCPREADSHSVCLRTDGEIRRTRVGIWG